MICDGRTHNLIVIYEDSIDTLTEAVIRWCENCGAVAVDRDTDNRTAPGYYEAMRFPTMTYPNQRGNK